MADPKKKKPRKNQGDFEPEKDPDIKPPSPVEEPEIEKPIKEPEKKKPTRK